MTLQIILQFASLWKSLEGKQQVTPLYIETYRKWTGVTIPSTKLGKKVEGWILIKTLRFSPDTLDKQIQSRFQILEKFSWGVPLSIEEECRRALENSFLEVHNGVFCNNPGKLLHPVSCKD